MVVTVVVTGGAIFLGSAAISNVNEKGCGDAYESWSKGDVYSKIGDNDEQALDQSVKCQQAINDSVAVAKPVATIMSASGNLGASKENVAALVVDRMMDMTDNLSNPSHKAPVRDSILPSSIVNFFWGEPEVEEKEKELKTSFGEYAKHFTDSYSQSESAHGVSVSSEYNLDGDIILNIQGNSASCSIDSSVEIIISGTVNYSADTFATMQSTNCSGNIDDENIFTLFGEYTQDISGAGQSFSDAGSFSIVGYLDGGDISGSIDIDGAGEIDF